jgi:peptide chain release factor 1
MMIKVTARGKTSLVHSLLRQRCRPLSYLTDSRSISLGRYQQNSSIRRRHGITTTNTTSITNSTVASSTTSNKCFNYYYQIHEIHSSSRRLSTSTPSSSSDQPFESLQMLEKIVSSSSITKQVERTTLRYDEIMTNMMNNDSSTSSSSEDETKELSGLSQIAKLYTEFKDVIDEMNEMHELMMQAIEEGDDNSGDNDNEQKELIQECRTEIETLEERLDEIGAKIIAKSIPHNDNDFDTDAILELRAGTGGDEASLFCGELMSCYEKVARSKGWVFDVLSKTQTDLKGVKEAAISISSNSGGGGGNFYGGDDDGDKPLGPYGYFKFESGVHRVQRVPVNDVRIHTSAASVGVLPAPSDSKGKSDDLLPSSELRIETMRASGAGGQHVNTTDSAVRITHIPTGIVASIQDERSQHKNKAKAMKLISARVRDKLEAEEARERGEAKNSLMGGGDRSERIRTYNFPQDRVTDHRCKQSEHGIEKLLSGGSAGGSGDMEDTGLVGIFLPYMKKMERVELLESLEEREQEANNTKNNQKNKKGKGKR